MGKNAPFTVCLVSLKVENQKHSKGGGSHKESSGFYDNPKSAHISTHRGLKRGSSADSFARSLSSRFLTQVPLSAAFHLPEDLEWTGTL